MNGDNACESEGGEGVAAVSSVLAAEADEGASTGSPSKGVATTSFSDKDAWWKALRMRLLSDSRIAFADDEALPTMALIERLREVAEALWLDLTPAKIAGLVRYYGIVSVPIEFPPPIGLAKGYRRAQFAEVWKKHVPQQGPAVVRNQTDPPPAENPAQGDSRPSRRRPTLLERAAAGELTKVTINLSPRALKALDAVCESTGNNKTESINRSVQIYAWLQDHIGAGNTVRVVDQEGRSTDIQVF